VQNKTVIETFVSTGSYGVARACRLFGLARTTVYRQATPDAPKMAQEGLIVETSRDHPSLGYRKVTACAAGTACGPRASRQNPGASSPG
jgi:hypothetical protein